MTVMHAYPGEMLCEALERRVLLATVDWVGGAAGNWSDPSNWSGGAVPGVGDDVRIIDEKLAPMVTLDSGNHVVKSLLVTAPQSRLKIDGGSLTLIEGGLFQSDTSLKIISGSLNGGTAPGAKLHMGGFRTVLDMSGGTLQGDFEMEGFLGSSIQWTGGEMAAGGTTIIGAIGGSTMSPASRIGGPTIPTLSRPFIYEGRDLAVADIRFVNGSLLFEPSGHPLTLDGTVIDGGGTNLFSVAGGGYLQGSGTIEVPVDINDVWLDFGGTEVLELLGGGSVQQVRGAGEFRVGGPGAHVEAFGAGSTFLGDVVFSSGTSTIAAGAIAGELRIGAGAGVRMLGDGSHVLRTGSLDIDAGGYFDLRRESMIVDYELASPLAEIRSYITSGYNGGAWDGNGIRSSFATGGGRAVGYAEASSLFSMFPATFAGEPVDDTAVLITMTLYGDANLDRTVNLSDFGRLAANFGTAAGWSGGDFNFDSLVNLTDFGRLAANFGRTVDLDDLDDE